MGPPEEAQALVRESLAIQQQSGDQREVASALRVLGWIALDAGRLRESERLARESVAAFQAVGDRARAAEALANLGQTSAHLGELAKAEAQLEESVAIYGDLGFSGSSCVAALSMLGGVELYLGRYDRARALAQESLAKARQSGLRLWVGGALMRLGWVAMAEGEYEKARQFCEQSSSYLKEPPDHVALAYVTRGLGQTTQVQHHICKALHMGAGRGGPLGLAHVLPAVALLLVDRGEVERAVELYALALRYPYVGNAPIYEDLAAKHIAAAAKALPPEVVEAAQARGRARDLEATVRELLAEFQEEGVLYEPQQDE